MKVKTISRTMSFGNYENISMSADVEDGETVGEAFGKLEAVINEEIKKTQQLPYRFQGCNNRIAFLNQIREKMK